MAYTSHGHHIPGTPSETIAPFLRARCGGPTICSICTGEAKLHSNWIGHNKSSSGDVLAAAAEVIDEDDMREHYVDLAESYAHRAEDMFDVFEVDDKVEWDRSVRHYNTQALIYATLASAYRGS